MVEAATKPSNIDYYLNRLNGYTKNTVRQQPVSKSIYQAGETTVIRLPTNAIVDLHTLNVQFDLQLGITPAGTPNKTGYWYDTMAGAVLNRGAADGEKQNTAVHGTVQPGTTTEFTEPPNAGQASVFPAVNNPDVPPNSGFYATPMIGPPRYVESLVRRVDVTMGGVQVGLGSLSDYGGIFNLLALNTLGEDKHKDMSKYELNALSSGLADAAGGAQSFATCLDRNSGAATVALSQLLAANKNPGNGQQGPYYYTAAWRNHLRNWLGFLGGNYMRFLDTNLLPDVEIRITWNQGTVLNGGLWRTQLTHNNTANAGKDGVYYQAMSAPAIGSFSVSNIKADFETIAFGDNSYRLMLDDRLATGEPIIVPFTNWSSFETGNGNSFSSVTQFTVATQSLDALYGTARANTYDASLALVAPGGAGFSSNILAASTSTTPGAVPVAGAVQVPYYQFVAQDFLDTLMPRYNFTVDSKNYPQFYADRHDTFEITKNSFDGGALSRGFESILPTRRNWADWAWALGISLMHNSDDTFRDRMISGLNTNGSNIPITWSINQMDNTNFRPIVFCELTSTLMIYAGRVISVIN